jgi:hypothetical protein
VTARTPSAPVPSCGTDRRSWRSPCIHTLHQSAVMTAPKPKAETAPELRACSATADAGSVSTDQTGQPAPFRLGGSRAVGRAVGQAVGHKRWFHKRWFHRRRCAGRWCHGRVWRWRVHRLIAAGRPSCVDGQAAGQYSRRTPEESIKKWVDADYPVGRRDARVRRLYALSPAWPASRAPRPRPRR